VIPALLFWNNSTALQLFSLLFGLTYIIVYRVLVMFSAPGWMTLQYKKTKTKKTTLNAP
jgi:hypothetical protein